MPVESCQEEGKPGFRWGPTGKCYTYGDEESRKEAIAKAQEQGRAIEARRQES